LFRFFFAFRITLLKQIISSYFNFPPPESFFSFCCLSLSPFASEFSRFLQSAESERASSFFGRGRRVGRKKGDRRADALFWPLFSRGKKKEGSSAFSFHFSQICGKERKALSSIQPAAAASEPLVAASGAQS
jgi:hypothetical protein